MCGRRPRQALRRWWAVGLAISRRTGSAVCLPRDFHRRMTAKKLLAQSAQSSDSPLSVRLHFALSGRNQPFRFRPSLLILLCAHSGHPDEQQSFPKPVVRRHLLDRQHRVESGGSSTHESQMQPISGGPMLVSVRMLWQLSTDVSQRTASRSIPEDGHHRNV